MAIYCSVSYLMPSGGRGSCLGLRTGVSPHFSTNSKREMLADHERGAASPPSSPMPDFRGCTLTRPRSHTDCARSTSSSASAATPRLTSPSHCYQLQFLTVTPLLHVARCELICTSHGNFTTNVITTFRYVLENQIRYIRWHYHLFINKVASHGSFTV